MSWRHALLAQALLASLASAQDSLPGHSLARELFEDGSRALDEGRFPDARDALERSLELAPRPATAFNSILALLGTEQPLEARARCRRLLAGAFGSLGLEHRERAERECARAEADIAHLTIRAPTDTEVRVDGENVDSRRVDVNPGHHVVSATSPDGRTELVRVGVRRGETTDVLLATVVLESDRSVAPDRRRLRRGAIVGSAVLAAIGAAIAIGFAVHDQSPIEDPVWGITRALR